MSWFKHLILKVNVVYKFDYSITDMGHEIFISLGIIDVFPNIGNITL